MALVRRSIGGIERLTVRNTNEVKVAFYAPSVNDQIRIAVRYDSG